MKLTDKLNDGLLFGSYAIKTDYYNETSAVEATILEASNITIYMKAFGENDVSMLEENYLMCVGVKLGFLKIYKL